jgi:hypothetical protein
MIELKAGAGDPDGALLIDAVRRLFALSEDKIVVDEPSTQAGSEATVTQLTAATSGSTGETK